MCGGKIGFFQGDVKLLMDDNPQESDEISLSCTLDGVRFFIFHTPL
jgi:hypothetical protein